MKNAIFIPKKCKVGFNTRQDTYTGKLGYVIYHDSKIWRKETSWKNWIETYISDEEFEIEKSKTYENDVVNQLSYALRNNGRGCFGNGGEVKNISTREDIIEKVIGPYDKYAFDMSHRSNDKSIEPVEFENIPVEGFVLNRKAGGGSSGWNSRQTYCRVYDPRGFEFELTIPNLLYILENATSIKGKGLEGKFVYGWEGKDLVLIPESAPEYIDLVEFSNLQTQNVKKSELVLGGIYIDSLNKKVTYLGEGFKKNWRGAYSATNALWFNSTIESYGKICQRIETKDVKSIKKYTGDIDPEFANFIDNLEKDNAYNRAKPEFELVKDPAIVMKDSFDKTNRFICYIKKNGKFTQVEFQKSVKQRYFNQHYFNSGLNPTPECEYKIYDKGYSTYSTIEAILNNYELWQQKMTK